MSSCAAPVVERRKLLNWRRIEPPRIGCRRSWGDPPCCHRSREWDKTTVSTETGQLQLRPHAHPGGSPHQPTVKNVRGHYVCALWYYSSCPAPADVDCGASAWVLRATRLKRARMSSDDHWISTRIDEARKNRPLVTGAVSARMHQLLEGPLSERPLSSTDLASAALGLIAGMAPAPSKGEANQ